MPEPPAGIDVEVLRHAHLDDTPAPAVRTRLLEAIRSEHVARRLALDGTAERTRWHRVGYAALAFASSALLVTVLAYSLARRGLEAEPPLGGSRTTAPTALPQPLALPQCARGRGDAGLVADFEVANPGDSFPLSNASDSRSGRWTHMRHDQRGFSLVPLHVLPSPEPRPGNQRALKVAGKAESGWGAQVGFELRPCYDASAYDGVEFRARGPGAVFVAFQTVTSVPIEAGGRCQDKCWFNGGRFLVLEDHFRTYSVRWRDVNSPDPQEDLSKELLQIQFSVQSGTAYDFWLDDVRFIERER